MMKRRYVAMISAVLCSAMILSACGNSKKTESIYTGDKTEVPAWQANLDAISPSAYADVEGLDLEPGTYISVIGRAGGTPYHLAFAMQSHLLELVNKLIRQIHT